MPEYSQGAIPADTLFLSEELDAATAVIRSYCRWHIARTETDLKHRHRTRLREDVWLPATQITAITAVKLDGKNVDDLTNIDIDPDTGWTSLRGSVVDVTYTAGFEEVPADLVKLTMKLVARSLSNPLDVIRQQVATGSVSYSHVSPNVAAGGTLLPHEMAQLDAYRVGWIG
ncbi:hypothetical protein [Microbacterium sp. Leaf436]|uniref:hypothetical protein n=1 Tax=Microbacterium sp. Leaf436 TaxID=1736377 RepID=UPI0012E3F8CD|nr:hypothetical protein [Microbacterium sp. Leaf436]